MSGIVPLSTPTRERDPQIAEWLIRLLGDGPLQLSFASDDASFRRYLRVERDNLSYILMDAPPAREDSRPFVRLDVLLRTLGMRTPTILAIDLSAGLLLLEDFGTETLFDAIRADDARSTGWLDRAVDTLAAATRQAAVVSDRLRPYDEAQVRRELNLFPVWFSGRHLGGEDISDTPAWQLACDYLVAEWARMPASVVHLDYHCRNLMITPDGSLGVIDFQDAVRGPVAYDLVSLLKDCYVSWPAATRQRLLVRYHAQASLPASYTVEQLRTDTELCGIQRHLKVAGIFARLCHRDGKSRYLDDLPRVVNYLREALPAYPALAPLCDWLPSDAMLDEARQCAR